MIEDPFHLTFTVPVIDPDTAITTLIAGTDQFTPVFIIDSGCSQPMCRDRAAFTTLYPDRTPVRLADGSVLYTQGVGSIGHFGNIYFVPDLQFNLLSVSYLNKLGFNVVFAIDKLVYVYDQQGNQQVLGSHQKGLYHTTPSFFQTRPPNPVEFHFSLLTDTYRLNFQELWHNRLAHMNDYYIEKAKQNYLVIGIDCGHLTNRKHCEACALTKAHRTPTTATPGSRHNRFNKSNKRRRSNSFSVPNDGDYFTLPPLQKFAVDLKGPITPTGIYGSQYALIFTCCSTRYRFVYCIKSKDETYQYTKSFISHVRLLGKSVKELQYNIQQYDNTYLTTNTEMKSLLHENDIIPVFTELKSDNGTEFLNSDMTDLFTEFNISHQTTSPYSPHQNGIAERTNRTVFEMATAMLYVANTPFKLWPYAVKHAVHILNIMPNKILNLQSTPYIEVYHDIPDIGYLRTFGCDAYMVLPDYQQPTMGLKAVKGIFVGYDRPRSLSYLVYYNNKVCRTGHVHFNEDLSSKNHANNELINHLNTLLQEIDSPPISDVTPVSNEALEPIEFTTLKPNSQSTTQPEINPHSIITPPEIMFDDNSTSDSDSPEIPEDFKYAPAYSTRSKQKVMYSELSNVSLYDSSGILTSGKYYDPDYEYSFTPQFHVMTCGVLTEEDALNTPERDKWIQAMMEEISKLDAINTWSIVYELPQLEPVHLQALSRYH